MTVNEVAMILAKVRATFPNWNVVDPKATTAVWAELLQGETYEDVSNAFRIYASRDNEFAPTPGQLLTIIKKNKPGSRSQLEILNDIKAALKNSTYGAEEEFKRLPKAGQMAIGSPDGLRRISKMGLDSYMESNLISRIQEAVEILDIRQEVLALENHVNVMLEDKHN